MSYIHITLVKIGIIFENSKKKTHDLWSRSHTSTLQKNGCVIPPLFSKVINISVLRYTFNFLCRISCKNFCRLAHYFRNNYLITILFQMFLWKELKNHGNPYMFCRHKWCGHVAYFELFWINCLERQSSDLAWSVTYCSFHTSINSSKLYSNERLVSIYCLLWAW